MSTGEAVLMRMALGKSGLLQKTDFLWKSTGRIFVRNSDDITNKSDENVFLYSHSCDSIQTWFFGIAKKDLEVFLSDDVIEDMSKDCIEYAWMRYYRSHKDSIRIRRFGRYPDAEGINSSGVPYTLPRSKWILKNILLKFGWFTVR